MASEAVGCNLSDYSILSDGSFNLTKWRRLQIEIRDPSSNCYWLKFDLMGSIRIVASVGYLSTVQFQLILVIKTQKVVLLVCTVIVTHYYLKTLLNRFLLSNLLLKRLYGHDTQENTKCHFYCMYHLVKISISDISILMGFKAYVVCTLKSRSTWYLSMTMVAWCDDDDDDISSSLMKVNTRKWHDN